MTRTPAQQAKSLTQMEMAYKHNIPYSRLVNDETIETKSGHLLQTIKINGLFAETLADEMIDYEKHVRNHLLMSLVDSTTSLYFHTIRKKHTPILSGTYVNEFAQQLSDKWQRQLNAKHFFINEHYLTIVKKPPVGKIRQVADLFRSLSNQFNQEERARYRHQMLVDINQIATRIMTSLAHYGVKKLSSYTKNGKDVSELLSFLSRLINLEDREIVAPHADLAAALPYKRLFFETTSGNIAIRNNQNKSIYAGMLSINHYVGTSNSGMLDPLLDIPAEFTITQSFSFLDKGDARKKMQEQARNQAQSDDGETTENAKINLTLDELNSNTAVSGEHHLSVLCQAASLPELEKNISVVDAALNQLGMIAIREDTGVKPAFFAMLPANHAYIVRRAAITSKNMASFASFHNHGIGQTNHLYWGEPVAVLETLSFTPYYFSFHVLDVANTIMIGPQGSGKTLLEALLLSLSMKFGGQLIIFDKDQGLEIFVRAMNGSYSLLSAGKRTGFAPFQLDDTPDNRYFLTKLLRKIATIKGLPISDEDELRLKAAVDGAYSLPKRDRILRNIVHYLGMRQAGSLRMRFESWVDAGEFAWVFDNEVDELALDHDVLGFDMTAVFADPFVGIPIYFYLFHRIGMRIDGTKTRIVVAEGWKALQDPEFRGQIKDWSSTPRKKETFLVIDTQSPEDISKSEIGCKVIQESVTQIYFANPKAQREDYITHFGLSEKEYEIVKTLDITSRFFLLKQGAHSVVLRADMKGLDDEINVLSGRTQLVNLLNHIRLKQGDDSRVWLPIYYNEAKKIKVESP